MVVGPVNSAWMVREHRMNSREQCTCPLKLKRVEKKKKNAWNARNADVGEKRWTQTLTYSLINCEYISYLLKNK